MTPSASTSSPTAIATRASASAGPRPAPTSTAITVRLARPRRVARPRASAALRFARQVGGEIDERAFRGLQGPRCFAERLLERRRAAVHAGVLRDPSVAEPGGAQRACVPGFGDAILLHDDGDVVAGAPAAEAGDVLHGSGGGAHAIRRSRASISWYTERARRTSAV